MLSKEVSSTIFWVFGMIRPGIEPWASWQLANTLLATPIDIWIVFCYSINMEATSYEDKNEQLTKHFLQNNPLAIQYTYSIEFSIGRNTIEILFSTSLDFSLDINIHFRKQEKVLQNLVWRVLHFHNPMFHKILSIKKYWNWLCKLFFFSNWLSVIQTSLTV